jgi:hypothetical protein
MHDEHKVESTSTQKHPQGQGSCSVHPHLRHCLRFIALHCNVWVYGRIKRGGRKEASRAEFKDKSRAPEDRLRDVEPARPLGILVSHLSARLAHRKVDGVKYKEYGAFAQSRELLRRQGRVGRRSMGETLTPIVPGYRNRWLVTIKYQGRLRFSWVGGSLAAHMVFGEALRSGRWVCARQLRERTKSIGEC